MATSSTVSISSVYEVGGGKGYQADFKCLGCFQSNRIYWCHD